MKKFIHQNIKVTIVIAAFLVVGVATTSFQNSPFSPFDKLDALTELADTIPGNNSSEESEFSIRDFDQLLQHLENENLSLQKDHTTIDIDKIQDEITASLNKIDIDKITMDIDRAMKAIDFAKIEREIQTAMSKIDWSKVNNDGKVSLQNAKKEMEKIDISAVKNEMKKAKEELEKSKLEIKKINVAELLKNANTRVAEANTALRLTKEMFIEMEKDGLIHTKKGFTIEFKDKCLYINSKRQDESIFQKYRPYIKGDAFRIRISKE